LATGEFRDANCEHMAEILREYYGIEISARTLRRILAEAGIRSAYKRKVCRKRRSRDRMAQEGLLVQCDASPYAWLEDRGPELDLHGSIDDATGKVLALYFRPHEDLYGYLQALKQMVVHHGVPKSFYSDRHTIFFSPKKDKLSIEEELAGKTVALTQATKGSTISYYGRTYQLVDTKGRTAALTPRSKVVVLTHLDGSISALNQDSSFLLREFTAPEPEAESKKRTPKQSAEPPKPAPDHLVAPSTDNITVSQPSGNLLQAQGAQPPRVAIVKRETAFQRTG